MGSSQSSTSSGAAAPASTTAPALDKLNDASPASSSSSTISHHDNDNNNNKLKRTGIDLVNHKCRRKKAAYDKCVSVFYREQFLAGKAVNQEEECGTLFDSYRQCYLKHLKREFFDKSDKKPKEGSILAEEEL